MPYDASDRKQIRQAEKAAARTSQDRIEFLRTSLSTIQGRAWFYNFLDECHCFSQPPAFDPHRDYFALGERNVGLRIFAEIIAHCPDQYLTMMKESNARDQLAATRQLPGSQNPDGGNQGRESDSVDGDPDADDNLVDYGASTQ